VELKPGYKQTEVGVIPEEWNVACVGDSFNVCNQFRLPISQSVRERMAGPYPYYGPTSVQGWINEYRVEGEYALIGEDGDHFLKWRSQPMTLLVRGKFNVNNHAHLLRGTKNLTEWFYWFFANRDMTPYLTRQGAGRYKLTKAALIQIPCALPPPPEQRAIAGALSDVDELIGALEHLIAKKRNLKQANMQQLLTGKKRLSGFSGQWEQKPIGEHIDLLTGFPFPSSQYSESGIRLLRGSNVKRGETDWAEDLVQYWPKITPEISKYKLETGDLVVAMDGSLVGRSYARLRPTDLPAVLLQRVARIRSKTMDVGFLSQFVGSDQFIHYCDSVKTVTAIPHISSADIRKFVIPIPPSIKEQTAIAAVLSDMDAELTALEQRRDKTRALKQGMMQELLTGRTRLV